MEKLAIIDLDGVVCDSSIRFGKATRGGKINWALAFHPPMLKLDTLIPNTDKILISLENAGWKVIFLSSRPDRLSEPSENWLQEHGLGGHELFLRPSQKGGLKTPQWKATMVCAKGAKAEQVIFVDDDDENLTATKLMWQEKVGKDNIRLLESLALVGEI